MAFSDRLKRLGRKAEKAGAEHKDQLERAIDKAETLADQRTQGKYTNQIRKAGAKAEGYVQGLESPHPPNEPPVQP